MTHSGNDCVMGTSISVSDIVKEVESQMGEIYLHAFLYMVEMNVMYLGAPIVACTIAVPWRDHNI